jgi:translocation protein SEC63
VSQMRVGFIQHTSHIRILIAHTIDSLAGQMNALKTGGLTGPPPKKKKKPVKEESSDEESDTEGEETEDTSETDTDTDEE